MQTKDSTEQPFTNIFIDSYHFIYILILAGHTFVFNRLTNLT